MAHHRRTLQASDVALARNLSCEVSVSCFNGRQRGRMYTSILPEHAVGLKTRVYTCTADGRVTSRVRTRRGQANHWIQIRLQRWQRPGNPGEQTSILGAGAHGAVPTCFNTTPRWCIGVDSSHRWSASQERLPLPPKLHSTSTDPRFLD